MSPTVRRELASVAADPGLIPAAVAALGLTSLSERRIDELSGGQQRRVGLAAALVRAADLVVLDEPMAGLDAESAALMVESLELLDPDAVVVAVTHDLERTAPILMQGRRGRVLWVDAGRLSEEVLA
jgi:ABC-type Mn2+/Zn2+ transport system ATPase subunit